MFLSGARDICIVCRKSCEGIARFGLLLKVCILSAVLVRMNKYFLIWAGVFLSSMAYAQVDCNENTAIQQVSICADLAKKEADTKLNDSYKALIDRAESRYIFQYQSQPEMQKAFLAKLKDSQRAWIKLRDTNCPLEGFENEWDKLAYSAELNRCVARMSLERATYLDKIIPER
ncbi:lysozyme inhibitor LprI family protein [Pseudomonas sp. LB3P38]|uniref:lysozyme inhibitor LprI family protein n=1 Tax=Pseudomonas lyxosi TaxID=3398358 RepID=UPI0039F0262B